MNGRGSFEAGQPCSALFSGPQATWDSLMKVYLSSKLEGAILEGILTPGEFHALPVDVQFGKNHYNCL